MTESGSNGGTVGVRGSPERVDGDNAGGEFEEVGEQRVRDEHHVVADTVKKRAKHRPLDNSKRMVRDNHERSSRWNVFDCADILRSQFG